MQCNIKSHTSRLTAIEVTSDRKYMQAKANTHRCYSAILLIGICLLLLTVTGCKQKGGPPQSKPEVAVVTVHPERVVITTELPGRTSAFRVAEIRPQVNGLILKRAFKEGSDVNEGDLLYQIDPAPYQAAYDQAKAAVAMANAQLPALRGREKRFKELVESHAVGQQDYDDALAALRQLEAQLQVSKAAMKSAKINLKDQSVLHTHQGAYFWPYRSVQYNGRGTGCGISAGSPCHYSATGPNLCRCAPIYHRIAATATPSERRPS